MRVDRNNARLVMGDPVVGGGRIDEANTIQLLAAQRNFFNAGFLDAEFSALGMVGCVLLAHTAPPVAQESGLTVENGDTPTDPDDTEEEPLCYACSARGQRRDIEAFACASAHPEMMCGTCTAAVIARGGTCPQCRAPARGYIGAMRQQ